MIFESHEIHNGKKGIFNIQCAYKLFDQLIIRSGVEEKEKEKEKKEEDEEEEDWFRKLNKD